MHFSLFLFLFLYLSYIPSFISPLPLLLLLFFFSSLQTPSFQIDAVHANEAKRFSLWAATATTTTTTTTTARVSDQATPIINDNCSTSLMALIKGSSAIPSAASLLLFFRLSLSLSLSHSFLILLFLFTLLLLYLSFSVHLSFSFFLIFSFSPHLTLFFFSPGFPPRRLSFQRVYLAAGSRFPPPGGFGLPWF